MNARAAAWLGRRTRWRRIGAVESPQLPLLLVHAAEVKSSALCLAAALRLHVVFAEIKLVAQVPTWVRRLLNFDWRIRTFVSYRRVAAGS